MSCVVLIDETKRRDYLLVAAVALPRDLAPLRRDLRSLQLPGQRRLHMKDENDRRKRLIADAISSSAVQATVYNAGRADTERVRRAACLSAVVTDHAAQPDVRLVLELDDSLLSWDNQCLIEYTRAAGCRGSMRWDHERATADNLLAIPDAIAWCWAKGGDWQRRVSPVVVGVQEL